MDFFNMKGNTLLKREQANYVPENKDVYKNIDLKTKQINKQKNSGENKRKTKKLMDADFAKDLLVSTDAAQICTKLNDDKYFSSFSKSYNISVQDILDKKQIDRDTPYTLVLFITNKETGEIEKKLLDSASFMTIPKFLKLGENLKKKDEELSLFDLQNIHQDYFENTSRPDLCGTFRKENVFMRGTSYLPPDPIYVKNEMENLFFQYNLSNLHPVEKITLLHLGVIGVQPFPDGNKKAARILANVLLHKHGYPTICAMEYNCKEYRNAVCDSLENSDATPIINYFANRINESCDNQLGILKDIRNNKTAEKSLEL